MSLDLLGSYVDRLDDLLHRIAASLQLTDTEYNTAEQRYTTITELLSSPSSPLADLHPTIYPQGSLKIGTSVRSIHRNEFDVDLVVEFDSAMRAGFTPRSILDAFESFLKSHGRYEGMVERMCRCIRLNYAGEFHMDILPAFATRAHGNGCIEIPDEDLRRWLESNPKGYADWFERRATIPSTRSFKAIEEIPDAEDINRKPPLKRVVQLLKRARDVEYSGPSRRSIEPPASIVLTTLAASYYDGSDSVARSLRVVLDRLIEAIDRTPGVLVVKNPVIDEVFSEAWLADPSSYRDFASWIRLFRAEWTALLDVPAGSIESVAEKLSLMFGEDISKSAVVKQGEYIKAVGIRRKVGAVGLTTSTTSATASIAKHNFFGA